MRNTERDVFNNILVQAEGVPGVGFAGIKELGKVREGGNVLWGLNAGPKAEREHFAAFRASRLFEESRQMYEPGWTTHDRVADPNFVHLSADGFQPADVRLQSGSPAIDAGLPIPAEWPDPLRDAERGQPDSGALPHGAESWTVGIHGRIPLFGASARAR